MRRWPKRYDFLTLSLLASGLVWNGMAYGDGDSRPWLKHLEPVHGFEARLEAASSAFLGRAYSASPTGDGPNSEIDERLPYDFDHFDCVTYIDTTWALAVSKTPETFNTQLDRIRYKGGERSYLTRNHYPDADWTRNNENVRQIEDITAKIAAAVNPPLKVATASFQLDRAAFFKFSAPGNVHLAHSTPALRFQRLTKIQNEAARIPIETATTPYLRIEDIFQRKPISAAQSSIDENELQAVRKHSHHFSGYLRDLAIGRVNARHWRRDLRINVALLQQIPNGAIVQIVKPSWSRLNWIGTPINITHRGLVFWRKGILYLRHATPHPGKVIEETLVHHLSWILGDPGFGGINVLRFTQLPPV